MAKMELPSIGGPSFEDLKQVNDHGAEYWSARDLQPLLGYSQWRRFEDAIKRAQISCEQSGNDPAYHFAGAGKMIELGKGGQREVEDYQLSRFACYLIAQNGDPQQAIRTHEQVGQEVRAAIERIGGERPENIPAAEPIKDVEKRIRTATPKLELDPRDAGGLLGGRSKDKGASE